MKMQRLVNIWIKTTTKNTQMKMLNQSVSNADSVSTAKCFACYFAIYTFVKLTFLHIRIL